MNDNLDVPAYVDLTWRFMYHKPDEAKAETHDYIRQESKLLALTFQKRLPEGREKSLALTKVEEAMFWANAAIARQKDETWTRPL